MNLATIIGTFVVAAVFLLIVGTSIRNKKNHKGGCSCGCSGCANSSICHPET